MTKWVELERPEDAWERLSRRSGPVWATDLDAWVIHRPEHVRAVAADPGLYSSAVKGPRDRTRDFLLTVDPPMHGDHRALFRDLFAAPLRRLQNIVPKLVVRHAQTCPRVMPFDLVNTFSEPLGKDIATEIIGDLEPGDLEPLNPAVRECLVGRLPSLDVRRSPSPILALYRTLICRGTAPEVAAGQAAGFAIALLVAARDTLPAAVTLALTEPVVAPHWPSPLLGLYRVATADSTVGDVPIGRGERLFLAWAAADHCSAVDGSRLMFGSGIHRCPAAGLVTRTVQTARRELIELRGLRSTGVRRFRQHPHFRGCEEVMVRLCSGGPR